MLARRWTLPGCLLALGLAAPPCRCDETAKFTEKPSASAEDQLSSAAQRWESAVLVVGDEGFGLGTAWVISKEHRLLATNAHVADMFHQNDNVMYAVCNGRTHRFKVERAWWHPGVIRSLKGAVYVRSDTPTDGEVFGYSPDVAVLQLKESDQELPEAFPLATPEELHALLGRSVAIMGYPAHDNDDFPAEGVAANATFHSGVISRLTDFDLSATGSKSDRQFLQHTALGWGGFSGSPIFLPNGHVVALHNSSRAKEHHKLKFVRAFSHGVRVDCLWELLVHHGLADLAGLTPEQRQVSVDRYLGPPSEEEKKLREAMAQVAEARELMDTGDYKAAGDLCNAVIEALPNYADAYMARLMNYVYYIDDTWETMPIEPFNKYHQYAVNDLEKLKQLTPSDPYLPLLMGVLLNRRGWAEDNLEALKQADAVLEKLRGVADQIPVAMVDGQWHALVYMESALARRGLEAPDEEVLALAYVGVERTPEWYVPYQYRASLLEGMGRTEEAQRDQEIVEALANGEPLPPPGPKTPAEPEVEAEPAEPSVAE